MCNDPRLASQPLHLHQAFTRDNKEPSTSALTLPPDGPFYRLFPSGRGRRWENGVGVGRVFNWTFSRGCGGAARMLEHHPGDDLCWASDQQHPIPPSQHINYEAVKGGGKEKIGDQLWVCSSTSCDPPPVENK